MELQDIITADQLHDNQTSVFEDVLASNAPKVIIFEGQPALILLDAQTYRTQATRLALLEKIVAGRKDVEAGRLVPNDQIMAELEQRRLKYTDQVDG
ncbi:MAG: hypothetical protein KA765_08675 [Thermoflexales bacterium]|nr:hypothetical protein [Thermoflexales bacterium]